MTALTCDAPSGLGGPAWYSCHLPKGHDGPHRSQSGHEWTGRLHPIAAEAWERITAKEEQS